MICWLGDIYFWSPATEFLYSNYVSVRLLQNWYVLLQMLINTYLPLAEIKLSCRGWNMKLYPITFATCFGDCGSSLDCYIRPISRSENQGVGNGQLSLASGTSWSCKSRPAHALGSAQWAADWRPISWSWIPPRWAGQSSINCRCPLVVATRRWNTLYVAYTFDV